MNIVRDGKTYTLTEEEVAMAHAEFVVSFMEDELISSFSLDEGMAKEVARAAYDRYCEGNGETEYECLEWAYDKYFILKKTSSKERLDLHSVKQTRFFQNVTSIIWRAHTAPANRLFNLLKTRKKNRSERISPQNK